MITIDEFPVGCVVTIFDFESSLRADAEIASGLLEGEFRTQFEDSLATTAVDKEMAGIDPPIEHPDYRWHSWYAQRPSLELALEYAAERLKLLGCSDDDIETGIDQLRHEATTCRRQRVRSYN